MMREFEPICEEAALPPIPISHKGSNTLATKGQTPTSTGKQAVKGPVARKKPRGRPKGLGIRVMQRLGIRPRLRTPQLTKKPTHPSRIKLQRPVLFRGKENGQRVHYLSCMRIASILIW